MNIWLLHVPQVVEFLVLTAVFLVQSILRGGVYKVEQHTYIMSNAAKKQTCTPAYLSDRWYGWRCTYCFPFYFFRLWSNDSRSLWSSVFFMPRLDWPWLILPSSTSWGQTQAQRLKRALSPTDTYPHTGPVRTPRSDVSITFLSTKPSVMRPFYWNTCTCFIVFRKKQLLFKSIAGIV